MRFFRASQQFHDLSYEAPLRTCDKASAHFYVVIQHVRLGRQNCIQCVPIAAEIRNQYFDLATRHAPPNFFDGARENVRTSVR